LARNVQYRRVASLMKVIKTRRQLFSEHGLPLCLQPSERSFSCLPLWARSDRPGSPTFKLPYFRSFAYSRGIRSFWTVLRRICPGLLHIDWTPHRLCPKLTKSVTAAVTEFANSRNLTAQN